MNIQYPKANWSILFGIRGRVLKLINAIICVNCCNIINYIQKVDRYYPPSPLGSVMSLSKTLKLTADSLFSHVQNEGCWEKN